jgi:hypothetical protein
MRERRGTRTKLHIGTGVKFIGESLKSFTVREAVRDLDIDDRSLYVTIVGRLTTFVTVHQNHAQHVNRDTRLRNEYETLKSLQTYLAKFDFAIGRRLRQRLRNLTTELISDAVAIVANVDRPRSAASVPGG